MIRNFIYTVCGLALFISGGLLGPKLWDFLQSTEKEIQIEKPQDIAKKPADEVKSEKVLPESDVKIVRKDLVSEKTLDIVDTEVPTDGEVKLSSEDIKDDPIEVKETSDTADLADSNKDEKDKKEEKDAKESAENEIDFGDEKVETIDDEIESGDRIAEIFEDYTDQKSAHFLINDINKIYPIATVFPGKKYTIKHNPDTNKILYFSYEINNTDTLIADFSKEKPKIHIDKIEYERKLSFVKGVIEDSLYLTMKKLNESDSLAVTVANMFKWDVNFIRDVKKGDSFSILVEKLYIGDDFKGYGRTLGGTFTNKGKTLESFLYYDANKKEMHYNAKGENMRKVLLQSPLRFTRVTSGYTHRRRHPVYGGYRPHLGIDYGAPTGTPIMAVGSGTVTYLGWRGGFGKHITVRHSSGLESLYSHLSRYARGVRKGSKVRQGQTIGYVGSTGVSTGPHLDFRLKQNGKYINPSKAINPRAEAVSKVHKQGYETRKKIIREFMNGTRSLESYDPKLMDVPGKKEKKKS